MRFARLLFLILTVLAVTGEAFTLEHSLSEVDQVHANFEYSIESEDLAEDQETWGKDLLAPWLAWENRRAMQTVLCRTWLWNSQQRFTVRESGMKQRRHRWLAVEQI